MPRTAGLCEDCQTSVLHKRLSRYPLSQSHSENGVEIKSILGDANQLPETWRSEEPTSTGAFNSPSINQLKEKMDNEGTYSVADALSGKTLKPRK